MPKFKPIYLIVVMIALTACFGLYVAAVNRNSSNMTGRQKILKALYPALMGVSRLLGGRPRVGGRQEVKPPLESFYDLKIRSFSGEEISLAQYRGKKLLLVNTASDCGYTAQLEELQRLYERFGGRLVIIGFPANDFKQQEKGTDRQIEQFCRKNYGVHFPLSQKSVVVKGPGQNPVFAWLTDPARNGWNDHQPSWNFTKYLVDEKGWLTHYFEPAVSPLSPELLQAVDPK